MLPSTCMSTPSAYRLAASRVSDRRTRPPLPSAPWLSDARSALTPLGRLNARTVLALLAIVALLFATTSIGLSRAAEAQVLPRGVITLTSQDPWVHSSNIPIRLGLRVRSSIPAQDLLVNLALYTEPDQSALASRYEFDTTAAGQLAGLNQLSLITFSLHSITEAHGSAYIYVGGTELSGQVPAQVPSDKVFELPCPPRYGGCGGVYPLQVSLVDVLTGQPVTVDSFTTYLIVVPSAVAPQGRLRFSFVVPVGAPVALAPAGKPTVSSETISRIESIAHAEASWPNAPLTVDVYGQTLLALARSRDHAKLVSILASERGAMVDGPFSAVNPTRLIRAGLETDLTDQFERGNAVFAKVLHVSESSRVYIATSPIGMHGLKALADDGVSRVVVPESNLQSSPSTAPAAAQWPYTLSAPFRIQGSSVEGVQADPGLAAHLSGPGSSALRAQQLLADLAELYFDSPNYQQTRGVVLVAPQSWAPEAGFLGALLRGLVSSPIVTTVSIGQLFQTVPRGLCQQPPSVVTGCSAAVRSILNPALSADGSITAGQVETSRVQLAELSSIIPSDTATIDNLGDAILLAETAGMHPDIRQTYLSAPLTMMDGLGSELSLPPGRTVTVTSSSARLPIAITSGSGTPLQVILAVSGANLTSSTAMKVVLRRGTTSFIVHVGTRTSGDSNLELQLFSPTGRLELAHAQFTIRSTAISGVAIALTASAGAFLLFWWFRSASRRRRRHAARHGRSPNIDPTSGAVPDLAP